jgi:phage/plasmid-associated DNA primase
LFWEVIIRSFRNLSSTHINHDFTLSNTTKKILLEIKRISNAIGAWTKDNCVVEVEGFLSRKETFEDYKNYADQELGKTPETERRFYQRLRDTPKVKDLHTDRDGRGFKNIHLRNPDGKTQKEGQTHLISTTVTTDTIDNFNCQKNLNSDKEEICNNQKPGVVGVEDKNSAKKLPALHRLSQTILS